MYESLENVSYHIFFQNMVVYELQIIRNSTVLQMLPIMANLK